MAMMSRMRSLAPWFMFLVGGLFVLFMVLSDSRVTEYFGSQRQNVGSVDGESISYQEFSSLVDRFQKQQEQQTGQQIDENQMDFFRNQVWEYLVAQKLIDKKVKEFGITISDEEVRQSIMGPNPPMFLRQQFTDSTGNFNRQLYETTMRDPRNKEIVISVEQQMRDQLIQEKLQNYLYASVIASDDEAKTRFIERNIKMKADYIFVDQNTIPENMVAVSDADLQKYFEQNADDYKIDAQRKVKYVLFKKDPSKGDSVAIKKNLDDLVAKLKVDTTSFKSYVEIYSEVPYTKDTVSLSDLPQSISTSLMNGTNGQVFSPVITQDGFVVYKLINKIKAKTDKVRASHILIRATGKDADDLKKATDIYSSIVGGAGFAQTAKRKSEDGSAPSGGDVGWFGKGRMVKEFEDACFNGKVGVVQKPVKTAFGYHIIKVTDRSNQEFVVEKIVNRIKASATTIDKLYQDAQDFSYVAKENGFESEAKGMKYSVLETPPFNEEAVSIPGVGPSTSFVKYAFENGVGEISDVFRVPQGYVVGMVSEVIKPGVKKFEEVKQLVKNSLLREKRLAKAFELAGEIKTKVLASGNPNDAKTVFAASRVDSTTEFTTQGTVPSLGRDFGFTDFAYKAELNKWDGPVKGSMGAYVIKVTYRTKLDNTLFEFEKASIKKELVNQKKSRYYTQWVQDLKKEADITDNRHLFYR